MDQNHIVEQYYNDNVESEWRRCEHHPIEFEVTRRLLSKNLPPAPARVIDIGGGPGRYSLWLASRGYEVTLFDLAGENIAYARKMAEEAQVRLREYITGDALDLLRHVQEGAYDIALLMGPLYHLIDENDRISVMRQTLAALKPGGTLVASFISGYAPIIDVLKHYPEKLNGRIEEYLAYLKEGINIVSDENPGFTTAYFIDLNKVEPFMANFNVEKKGFYTTESILGPYEENLKKVDERTWSCCMELAMRFVEDPYCRACGEHFLYIGVKK